MNRQNSAKKIMRKRYGLAEGCIVCLHGSAKSLIAAEYFNRIAIERNLPLRATTSGPEPDREVPGSVVAGLKSHGIDVRQYHPALSRPSNSPTPASRGFAVGDE